MPTPTGKDSTTPEKEVEPEGGTDKPKPAEETPSSHETSGQFPADEVAATFTQDQPKQDQSKKDEPKR